MNKWIALFFCLWSCQALAFRAEPTLTDPAQEARAQAIFREVRCVVCQGESIADSQAEVARDMRAVVREHIAKNESNADIIALLTHQYGNSILMQPPLSQATLLLWVAPLIIFLFALLTARRYFARAKP